MLQIIGWLGCFYLIVKGLEIAGRGDSYIASAADPERMEMRGSASVACLLAYAGAFGFAVWLLVQGQAGMQLSVSEPFDAASYSSFADCLNAADEADEISACSDQYPN